MSYVKETIFHRGCDTISCTTATTIEAIELAKSADHVVLVMGLTLRLESEGNDCKDLVLPEHQQSLINSVARAAKKPVVLVLLCGGPVDVSLAKNDPNIGSILWAGYPGEEGGQATAEIIFGDHNPGGRLPMTWYPNDFIKVPMTNMRMRPNPSSGYQGRTYRFYQGEKVFEFGYGLSYSNYLFKIVSVNKNKLDFKTSSAADRLDNTEYISVSDIVLEWCEKAKFSALVSVENLGNMAGKHPVLLFLRRDEVGDGAPMKQLIGFQPVSLIAKEKANVEFEVNPCKQFSSASEDGTIVIDLGAKDRSRISF